MKIQLSIDDHFGVMAEDAETQRLLFVLIKERTSLSRRSAEMLLKEGKMLIGKDLVAMRADLGGLLDTLEATARTPAENPSGSVNRGFSKKKQKGSRG